MKWLSLFITTLIVPVYTQAQNPDSLLRIFHNATLPDTVRLEAIQMAGRYYLHANIDSALLLFNNELNYARKVRSSKYQALALKGKGSVSICKGDLESALMFIHKSLKINEHIHFKKGIADCLIGIGAVYFYQNNHSKAREYYEKARLIHQEIQDKKGIALTGNILGGYEPEKHKALAYYQESLNIYRELDDQRNIAQTLENIGVLHGKHGDTAKYIYYLNKTLTIQKELHAKKEISVTLGLLGDVYFARKNYTTTLNYYRESFAMTEDSDEPVYRKDAAFRLYLIHKKINNPAEALKDYELYIQLRDSIVRKEIIQKTAEIQTKYETEQKEAENTLLKQQKKLHESEIKSKKYVLYIVLASALLLITFLTILIITTNLRKKKSELKSVMNLQKDKERIARDLHDNVGGQLSYIIYSLDGIHDESREKRIEITNSIHESVRSVISNLRETIWAISDPHIPIQDFSDKLKVFSKTLFKHSHTKVIFTETIETQRELNALLGLNLYRICQEILTNAFKYASAAEVKIDITSREGNLVIRITDNGKGFTMHQQKKEQYGLQNIRKRAAELGIVLTSETEIDQGTTYELIV